MASQLEKDLSKVEAGAHHLRARYLLDSGENWKAFSSYCKAAVRDPGIFTAERNRIAFALLNSIIPLKGVRNAFINRRTRAMHAQNYDRLLEYIK